MLMPNLKAVDLAGQAGTLWDYRQKSHTVLIHEPSASAETLQSWNETVLKNKKQWDWLAVKFLRTAEGENSLETGIYIIDRYSHLIRFYPSMKWTFEEIEKDFIYYESCNC